LFEANRLRDNTIYNIYNIENSYFYQLYAKRLSLALTDEIKKGDQCKYSSRNTIDLVLRAIVSSQMREPKIGITPKEITEIFGIPNHTVKRALRCLRFLSKNNDIIYHDEDTGEYWLYSFYYFFNKDKIKEKIDEMSILSFNWELTGALTAYLDIINQLNLEITLMEEKIMAKDAIIHELMEQIKKEKNF